MAVQHGRIMPYYQPKVDLRTGRIVGAEALLRWFDAGDVLRYPADMQPAFATPVLAMRIFDLMLAAVVKDMQRWLSVGLPLPVSINLSHADMCDPDLLRRVFAQLDAHSVPPHLLEVEITEDASLHRSAEIIGRNLKGLAEAGVRISLDDFGTGYASLTHLKSLPIDYLKLDRSFIRDIARNEDDQAIVGSMIALARALRLDVVAEGVEHADQADRVLDLGCEIVQGFLYGRAVPASHLTQRLMLGGQAEAQVSPREGAPEIGPDRSRHGLAIVGTIGLR